MIHHLSLGTNDVERASVFYDAIMGVLGLHRMKTKERELIYGASYFLLSVIQPSNGQPATAGNGSHVAFAAESRAMVRAFHQAAILNGGRDAGLPGLRAEYDPHYYAAFVLDPDGNKLEVVTMSSR